MPRIRSLGALARAAVLVAVLIVVNFLLPRALPGDPLAATLSGGAAAPVQLSAGARAELAAYYGLDLPLGTQFDRYLGDLAHGDLGRSITAQRPVADVLASRLGWSVLLAGLALVLAAVAGTLLGLRAALRYDAREERVLTASLVLAGSLPEFVIGLVLLALFAVWLRLLPATGAQAPFASCAGIAGVAGCTADVLRHLVLPVATLTIAHLPGFYLIARAAALAERDGAYLVAARARGLTEWRIALGHLGRNAIVPVAALFGARAGLIVGGVVVVETLFAYPGVGQLAFESLIARDYPVLQAVFLLTGLAVIAANAAADLVLPRLDPRLAATAAA